MTHQEIPIDYAEELNRMIKLELSSFNLDSAAVSAIQKISTEMFYYGQSHAMDNALTSPQVAEKLGITEGLVRKLARKMGVGTKVSGSHFWLFLPQDVERLEKRNKTVGHPEKEW